MKRTHVLILAVCAVALAASCQISNAVAQNLNVDISMNVFPTNLANPNGGGTWRIVAKTNSTQGIAAISAYLHNVSIAGLGVENDIADDFGGPYVGTFSGAVNILYFQDTVNGPLLGGVGTLSSSDGPDPFGNPAWDDATRIFSGAYSSIVPSFATNVGSANNNTDANTFAQVMVGLATLDANTTTVVRVAAIPEPATVGLAISALLGIAALRRQR